MERQTATYGGVPHEERRARRRRQLIDAALQEIAEAGFEESTVASICKRAGLTSRYFYENFDDRASMLSQLYGLAIDRVLEAASAAVLEAEPTLEARSRAGAEAYLEVVENDPRLARVIVLESAGRGGSMRDSRGKYLRQWAEIFLGILQATEPKDEFTEDELHINARATVAATDQMVLDWASGQFDFSRSQMADHLVRLHLAIARAPR